jgi:hypothetical protein
VRRSSGRLDKLGEHYVEFLSFYSDGYEKFYLVGHVAPKCSMTFSGLHIVISQKV